MRKLLIREGDTYGEWTVIKEVERRSNRRYFKCKCSCGNMTEVFLGHLRNGSSSKCSSCKGLYLSALYRHDVIGVHDKPLYSTYANMKQRCKGTHSGSATYIANNIKIDGAWSTFKAFESWALANGYFEGSVLHRVDHLGNYSPTNCIFMTKSDHVILHGQNPKL